MEVIFLSREDFRVLDYGFVDNDYQIVIDSVIPQKSTFLVNKKEINASIGDFLVVKSKAVNYVGIIVAYEDNAGEFSTKIQTADFISILDISVKLKSFSGNMCVYLNDLIRNAYVTNSDVKQRMSYLTINNDGVQVTGTLNFEADTLGTITSVVEMLNKAYSIGVFYSLNYEQGKIKGITLHIRSCNKGLVLKSDLAVLSNLAISKDSTQSTNKITFIPSDENVQYKNQISYYLLTDGSITNDPNDSRRFQTIYSVARIFKDADFSTLITTAQSDMLSSSLEHSIKFDLHMDNLVVVPFKDLNVGDFIEFITPTKNYQTMVTQITFKNSLNIASFTLGEYRGNLTEKLKLLSKK